MKKLLIIIPLILISCTGDDNNRSNCNFLFDAGVNLTVNTNLPQFSQLQFASNGVYVSGQGNNGIWLWRLNSATLLAWDAAASIITVARCRSFWLSLRGRAWSGCADVGIACSIGRPRRRMRLRTVFNEQRK